MIRTVEAIRYVTPLREGGSLPAIVEASDGGMYAMKFVGAGQGAKALIAEVIAGEIGRALGLRVPEIVFMTLDPAFGRSEPDPEIQDLLRMSAGLNLGYRYLPGAHVFNVLLKPPPDAGWASRVVWFDAYVTNVDRTAQNVNLLVWQGDTWLIDHGAALYFHHNWDGYLARSQSPFPSIKNHTLIQFAGALREADAAAHADLTPDLIRDVVDLIPDAWLGRERAFASQAEHREAYVAYLLRRLESSPVFVEEAVRAHSERV